MGYYNENWEWVNDDPTPVENPYVPPPAPKPTRYDVPPGNNQWGIPVPSPNPSSYDRDLSYWIQNGVAPTGPEGIFDANGQIRPGWERTGRGYERTPTTTNQTGDYIPTTYGGPSDDGGGFDGGGFGGWPSYTAPAYQSPGPFTPRRNTFSYTPFSHPDFAAPTVEQARENPGYKFAAEEGINRLESSAAGRGTLRSGMTLKDIYAWGNKFADQNYNQVFDRELTTYGTNRANKFDAYKTNLDTEWNKFNAEYGIDRDVYDRYATDTFNGNNYRLSASQAEFAPKFDAAKMEFADAYNQWKAKLDAATNIATGGPG
jgi:hypothetical protein